MKKTKISGSLVLLALITLSVLSFIPGVLGTTYTLTVSHAENGYIDMSYTDTDGYTYIHKLEGTYQLGANYEVLFTAYAAPGYIFDHFTYNSIPFGSGNVYQNPLYTHLLSSFTVGAVFVSNETAHIVSATGSTGTSDGWSLDGGVSYQYYEGNAPENSNVTAFSIGPLGYGENYAFSEWTVYVDDVATVTSSANPFTYNITDNADTRFFAQWDYVGGGLVPLTVVIQGGNTAGGCSWSNMTNPMLTHPAGTYAVNDGDIINLVASTSSGYTFKQITVTNGSFISQTFYTKSITFTVAGPTTVLIWIDTPDFSTYDNGTGINFELTALIYTGVGVLLSFMAAAIFLKASGAWFIGLILTVLGLVLLLAGQPSLIGLSAWGLTWLLSVVFLFGTSRKALVQEK
jgi:hypothetical protein